MTLERQQNISEFLHQTLKGLADSREPLYPKSKEAVHNYFNPRGIELQPYLDNDHMPQITEFTTVIVSHAFSSLRGIAPASIPIEPEEKGDSQQLFEISSVAAHAESYKKSKQGIENRIKYLIAMGEAGRELYRRRPVRGGEIVVPIERCGGNIARYLRLPNTISIEVKRLRFKGFPNLLGAGINLDPGVAERFKEKRLRLLEGVVASGSTIGVIGAALRNSGIAVSGIDCDAVIVCPAGAQFAGELRDLLYLKGKDRSIFTGGVLDKDWYVRYHPEDPLLGYFQTKAIRDYFIGKQVLGDGGDLTSLD